MSEANELRKPSNPAEKAPDKGVGDILGDAVHSALYTAIQEPISGVTQIVDEFAGTKYLPKVQFIGAPVQAQFGSADWHAQQVGSAVGMLLPFMLVGKGVRGVLGTSAEEASLMSRKAAFGMSMKEAGLTGFAYDAVLRPSDSKNAGLGQFLLDRGTQGAVGAGTFMTLTGASLGLNRFAGSAMIERSALVPLLKNPIASGVLSGIPAGLFSAEASSLTKTGHLASGTELGQAVYGMAVIGGAFGTAHILKAPGENGGPSRIDALTARIKDSLSSTDKAPRAGLSLLSGDIVGPDGPEHSVSPDGKVDPPPTTDKVEPPATDKVESPAGGKVEPTAPVDAPFDGNPVTDASLADLAKNWGAKFTPAKAKGKGGAPIVAPVDAAPLTEPVVDKAASTIDLLPKEREVPPVVNADLKDATAGSAAVPEANTEASPGKRTIKLPDVEVSRHEDLTVGIKALNEALKAQDVAKGLEDKAVLAEAKAKDPLAAPEIVQAATEARTRADEAQKAIQEKRQAFSDYVAEKGQGLQSHLENVATQMKHPDAAREIVQHDFAVTEGKALLTAAVADGATPEQQAAFDTFVREKGSNIKPELEKLGEEAKNSDIARALLERAYAPREISLQVDDVGQQAALNVGLKVLTKPGGIDPAALEKYAKDYGPAMEKHMLTAADQLGYGIDTKIQIGEAYHGEPFKQGVALLKAPTLDVPALQEFAQNGGKALEKQMAQTALDLGLDANKQLALREAYRGVESWVPVDGKDGQFVPVKPEQEERFRIMLNLLDMTADPAAPPNHINIVREWLKSPESAGLEEPLTHYAELKGDPHVQALLRETLFPTENMTVSGKPATMQFGDLLGGTTPEAIDRQNRFQNFSDLTQQLRDAPESELAAKRHDVFDWLNRNEDLYDAATRMGEQSADSRVVSALDSYFGTKNLEPFITAKEKYDKIAAAITPELIARMQKPGGELFWELAPPALETPRMWGGSDNISTSRQALRIQKGEDGTVVAEFNPTRHPDQVSKVTDAPDGTRTIDYADGTQLIQMPQGYDINVKADGSWRTDFANGNFVEENVSGNVARVIYENGAETKLYRDGEVKRTGADDQAASKFTDGSVPGPDAVRHEENTASTKAEPTLSASSRAEINANVGKLSSGDYAEASVAAIRLKNSFGQMTDTQFVNWLNFATGTHVDAFSPGGRSVPNWPDLQMRDGQVLLQDNVQKLLRGGDTVAEQQSPDGMTRAFEARTIMRQFLNAPEGRPSDLQYPAWLVKGNLLPPESLPENILKDLRVRFPADQLPADVKQYLDQNPERIQAQKEGDKRPPRGPFQLPKDDIPSRLRVMSDVLQFAPPDIQMQLLKLGAADGRALKDVMQVITPPRGERDRAQPVEFKQLLEMTVPQARDIYTVKLMIQAIKDAAWSKDAAVKEANSNLANKAALQLLPDSTTDQTTVLKLVSGLASGEIKPPFEPRPRPGEAPKKVPGVAAPGVGKFEGQILREAGLRPGEDYPYNDTLDQGGDEFPASPLDGGPANHPESDFQIEDWLETTSGDPNATLDGADSPGMVNNADTDGIG